MTVMLQSPYKGQNPGTLYTGSDEAALVASGSASLIAGTEATGRLQSEKIATAAIASSSDRAAYRKSIVSVGGLAPVEQYAYVAVFGDSRAWASETPLVRRPRSVGYWLGNLSHQALRYDYTENYGVSGERTDEVLKRIDAVIASRANIVVGIADTNDYDSSTPTDTVGNLLTMATRLRDAGKTFVYVMPQPRGAQAVSASAGITPGGDNTLTATQLAKQRDVISRIRRLGPAAGMILVDVGPYLVDPASTTFTPRADLFYDGLHWTPYVAFRVAQAILAALVGRFTPVPATRAVDNAKTFDPVLVPYGNMTINPAFSGTGGTYTDVANATASNAGVAASWRVTCGNMTGATVTPSKTTDAFGFEQQSIVVGGAAPSGSAPSITVRPSSLYVPSEFSVGDKVEAFLSLEVADGMAGVRDMNFLIRPDGNSANDMIVGGNLVGQGFYPNVGWIGTMRVGPFEVTAPLTSLETRLIINGVQNVAMAANIKLNSVTLRKIAPSV